MKDIVVLGGGTGTYTVLSGLKEFTPNLTAIVSMADSGGSTGRLRDEQGVLPPGDIRSALVALSQSNELTRELFTYRFQGQGGLSGHNFGNLLIAALEKITGSFEQAVSEAGRMLSIVGSVVPVTTEKTNLVATLEDGQVIEGEEHIDVPKHDANLKIAKVVLKPKPKPTLAALHAIEQADLIILGPGDLFSSVIPLLLVDKVPEAIRLSKAKTVYVANLMTKHGETDGYEVGDFVDQIEHYLGKGELDYVVFNKKVPPAALAKKYAAEEAFPVSFNRPDKRPDWLPVPADVAHPTDLWRHDPKKLARLLLTVSELHNVFAFADDWRVAKKGSRKRK